MGKSKLENINRIEKVDILYELEAMNQKYLTTQDVRSLFGIKCRQTIYEWMKYRGLKAERMRFGRYMFSARDIRKFILENCPDHI